MKQILFIENLVDAKSSQLAVAIDLARAKRFELTALFVIPVHPDVADWIDIQEKQIREAETKVKEFAEKTEAEFKERGETFRWTVVQSMPDAWMNSLEALTPVDVVVAGKIDFEPLAEKGIKTLEDLSSHFKCPAFPVESLMAEKKEAKGVNLLRFAAFGALSAVSYFLFFPQLDILNHVIFMKGTFLGALAVMVVVPIHAYIYGSFTEYFTKFIGLERSMTKH